MLFCWSLSSWNETVRLPELVTWQDGSPGRPGCSLLRFHFGLSQQQSSISHCCWSHLKGLSKRIFVANSYWPPMSIDITSYKQVKQGLFHFARIFVGHSAWKQDASVQRFKALALGQLSHPPYEQIGSELPYLDLVNPWQSSCLDEDTTNFRMVLKRLNCKPWLSKLAVILGVIFTVELARASRKMDVRRLFFGPAGRSSFWMLRRCYGSLPSAWIFSQSLGSCLSLCFAEAAPSLRFFLRCCNLPAKGRNIPWTGCFFMCIFFRQVEMECIWLCPCLPPDQSGPQKPCRIIMNHRDMKFNMVCFKVKRLWLQSPAPQ